MVCQAAGGSPPRCCTAVSRGKGRLKGRETPGPAQGPGISGAGSRAGNLRGRLKGRETPGPAQGPGISGAGSRAGKLRGRLKCSRKCPAGRQSFAARQFTDLVNHARRRSFAARQLTVEERLQAVQRASEARGAVRHWTQWAATASLAQPPMPVSLMSRLSMDDLSRGCAPLAQGSAPPARRRRFSGSAAVPCSRTHSLGTFGGDQ